MNEDVQFAIDMVKGLWFTVRSNRYFVAFEGGATGAALSFIDDAATSGHLDFSSNGLHKLGAAVIVGGITAVRLLSRPVPGTNPTSNQ